MICISIRQESRRLALVDMHNAAKQCDLLEIRLDRFGVAPAISELLERKPAPVIMACRRKKEGGDWDGSEAERLALLRQCIVSKADYVEIEVDVADEIRRMPPTKRVIVVTLPADAKAAEIHEKYQLAQKKDPDVIKFITSARTPEQVWPYVQILAKPAVPTVVMGAGKPGVMLAVLGAKIGAPWTYAALEKGMEAYPDQPSVRELVDIYHYRKIDKKTRMVGVTGFGRESQYTVAALNAVFDRQQLPARCLPLSVGSTRLFAKVIDAVHLASVVVDQEHRSLLYDIADELHPSARRAELVDLLMRKGEKWHGYFTVPQAIGDTLIRLSGGQADLASRAAVVIGIGPLAQTVAAELLHRKAGVTLAGTKRKAVAEAAQKVGCKQALLEAIYTSVYDTLIIAERDNGDAKLHPALLKENISLLDLTTGDDGGFYREAEERGCKTIYPREVLLDRLRLIAKLLTGKSVEPEWIQEGFGHVDA